MHAGIGYGKLAGARRKGSSGPADRHSLVLGTNTNTLYTEYNSDSRGTSPWSGKRRENLGKSGAVKISVRNAAKTAMHKSGCRMVCAGSNSDYLSAHINSLVSEIEQCERNSIGPAGTKGANGRGGTIDAAMCGRTPEILCRDWRQPEFGWGFESRDVFACPQPQGCGVWAQSHRIWRRRDSFLTISGEDGR